MHHQIKDPFIISGFPGIGKSEVQQRLGSSAFADIDSKKYQENKEDWPQNYFTAIEKAVNAGKVALVAQEPFLVSELQSRYLLFSVIPAHCCKNEYIARYVARKNRSAFIEMMESNYNRFVDNTYESYEKDDPRLIVLGPGQYLSDAMPEIMRRAKALLRS